MTLKQAEKLKSRKSFDVGMYGVEVSDKAREAERGRERQREAEGFW